jgi:hypothetical protein
MYKLNNKDQIFFLHDSTQMSGNCSDQNMVKDTSKMKGKFTTL